MPWIDYELAVVVVEAKWNYQLKDAMTAIHLNFEIVIGRCRRNICMIVGVGAG